jgi:hypothetical protein
MISNNLKNYNNFALCWHFGAAFAAERVVIIFSLTVFVYFIFPFVLKPSMQITKYS